MAPAAEARDFVRELRAVSRRPVVHAELRGAQHAFDVLPSVRARHVVHAVERFLAVVRSEHERDRQQRVPSGPSPVSR